MWSRTEARRGSGGMKMNSFAGLRFFFFGGAYWSWWIHGSHWSGAHRPCCTFCSAVQGYSLHALCLLSILVTTVLLCNTPGAGVFRSSWPTGCCSAREVLPKMPPEELTVGRLVCSSFARKWPRIDSSVFLGLFSRPDIFKVFQFQADPCVNAAWHFFCNHWSMVSSTVAGHSSHGLKRRRPATQSDLWSEPRCYFWLAYFR